MTCIVPQPDRRLGQIVFVTQGTQAGGAQEEVSAGSGFKPEPPSCQNTQEVPAGKEQDVSVDGSHSAHEAVGPDTNLFRGFPSRTPVAEQLPVGAPGVDVSGAEALVITVIPFEQAAIHLRHAPEARQFARPGGATQWTGEDLGEGQTAQPLHKATGIAFAALGERLLF
jgi:hypothetical protein